MPTEKKDGGLANLKSLTQELPTQKKAHRPRLRLNRKKAPKPTKVQFPDCFAEVNRLSTSKEPADARHRAALEAVASTLPSDARLATGAKAAGIYLAALVTALRQVLVSVQKNSINVKDVENKPEPRKKNKKKQRRLKEMQNEQALLEMSFMEARAPQNNVEDAQMNALDSVSEAASADSLSEDAHFVASIVYLILLSCRGANRALINAKAAEILVPINSALTLPAQSPLLARHAAAAITVVLSLLDSSSWNAGSSHVSSSFLNLLSIASSNGPKNRRKARECLVLLMGKVPLSAFRAVCTPAAVAWFIRVTSALASEVSSKSADTTNEVQAKNFALLLHHVTVVKYFAFVANGVECAKLAKQLLSIAQGSNLDILPFLYDSLSFLFCIPKNSAELSGVLSAQYARIMAEGVGPGLPSPRKLLRGEQPRISQADALKLVEAVVASSLPASCPIEPRIARARALLTTAVSTYVYYPHSPPPSSLTVSVVEAMVNVIDHSASKIEVKQLSNFLQNLVNQKEVQNAPKVFNLLAPFAFPKYKSHRTALLPIFKDFLSSGLFVNHPQSQDILPEFLYNTLLERSKGLSTNDRQSVMLMDGLLCAIVRGGGVVHVLKSIPLKWDSKTIVTNAWAIGILKDNVRYAPIELWKGVHRLHKHLEHIAEKLKAETLKGQKHQDVLIKNTLMYSHQILALFPGFCTNPTDLSHSNSMAVAFSMIDYCMKKSDNSDQLVGCSALRNLSESVTASSSDTEAFTSGTRSSFSSRLKKLFPTILNLAEKQNPEKRLTLIQAISSACIACSDEGVVANLLRATVRRFLVAAANKLDDEMELDEGTGQSKSSRTRHAAADVSIAIVETGCIPLESKEYDLLKRAVLPLLDSNGHPVLQKKAYKAISTLVSVGACIGNVESVKELVAELGKSGSNLCAGALPSRLSLIKALIERLSAMGDEQAETIKFCTSSFLAEAILALRATSEKGRQMGIELINTMARAWAKSSNPQLGLNNFFIAIAAGFGGKSTAMISGSLTAFGSFLQNFKEEIRTQDSLRILVESMLAHVPSSSDAEMKDNDSIQADVRPGPVAILLRHDVIEVQKAAIGAVKAALGPLGSPVEKLVRLLPGILPGLVSASADSKKRDIRLRVKVVIERLLRKCGREVVEGLFPDEHKKLLSSVRKELHKIERKRKRGDRPTTDAHENGNVDLYSSDDEEDDEDRQEAKRIRFK